ncbi:MAG: hypothetical protein IJS65_08860 [Clostridia bacterium]|nr:hypothetical protein [Clostridia bacterium]
MDENRDLAASKENADRLLLKLETYVGISATVIFLGAVYAAALINMPLYLKILTALFGVAFLVWGVGLALKAEQTAGFYECPRCGERYVPTYKAVFWAPHIGTTRKMRCPYCGERAWHKKFVGEKEVTK